MFSAAFRVDSSYRIGSGHLVRSITLARALRSKGADVSFVCRVQPGAAIKLIEAAGFTAILLPPCPDDSTSAFSSVPEGEDAEQTVNALASTPDWLFVDHYEYGIGWESRVRDRGMKLGVIDDLARTHTCDLLVDPNWHGNEAALRYKDKLPSHTTALLGPAYALLGPEFAPLRKSPVDRKQPVNRVLVYFGGSDANELSAKTAKAFSAGKLAALSVDIVVGATTASDHGAAAVMADRPAVRIVSHQPSLAPLLSATDLAIGAVGGTTWERMCLGVPTLAVVLADNQRGSAKSLADEGLIRLLGEGDKLTSEAIASQLLSLLDAPEERQQMADKGQALVDGRGVERVVDRILALS